MASGGLAATSEIYEPQVERQQLPTHVEVWVCSACIVGEVDSSAIGGRSSRFTVSSV